MKEFAQVVREAVDAALEETTDKLIAIGSSTGGVEALNHIIPSFPANACGMVIVQHMPAGVTAKFAERLNGISAMRVKEAQDGDRVMTGLTLAMLCGVAVIPACAHALFVRGDSNVVFGFYALVMAVCGALNLAM